MALKSIQMRLKKFDWGAQYLGLCGIDVMWFVKIFHGILLIWLLQRAIKPLFPLPLPPLGRISCAVPWYLRKRTRMHSIKEKQQHGNNSINLSCPPFRKKQLGTSQQQQSDHYTKEKQLALLRPFSTIIRYWEQFWATRLRIRLNSKPRKRNLSHWKHVNFQIPTVAFFSRWNCAQYDTVSIPVFFQNPNS